MIVRWYAAAAVSIFTFEAVNIRKFALMGELQIERREELPAIGPYLGAPPHSDLSHFKQGKN